MSNKGEITLPKQINMLKSKNPLEKRYAKKWTYNIIQDVKKMQQLKYERGVQND